MNEERLEYLINEMYYNYLPKEEAQELIDYILNLRQENQQLKELIECLKLGVTLNQEQEELLDKVLFSKGSDNNE